MPGEISFVGFEYEDVCYGSVENADEYFARKKIQALDDWSGQPSDQKQRALCEATAAIDALLYRGKKTAIYSLYASNDFDPANPPSEAAVKAAGESQPREFPRDGDTDVPEDVVAACYEEAQSILCGRNAGLALENLAVTSDGAGSTRTSYDRSNAPARHLVNGITSYFAWRFLQPFLADISTFNVRRV